MVGEAGDGHRYRVRLNGRDVSLRATKAVSFLGYGKVWLLHIRPRPPFVHCYTQWGRVSIRRLT